jgi:hypothetical protein
MRCGRDRRDGASGSGSTRGRARRSRLRPRQGGDPGSSTVGGARPRNRDPGAPRSPRAIALGRAGAHRRRVHPRQRGRRRARWVDLLPLCPLQRPDADRRPSPHRGRCATAARRGLRGRPRAEGRGVARPARIAERLAGSLRLARARRPDQGAKRVKSRRPGATSRPGVTSSLRAHASVALTTMERAERMRGWPRRPLFDMRCRQWPL